MSSRPARRSVTRALALGLSALLAAGSLSFAAATAASAAEEDSSVVVPITGLGEVTISKTKNLADGETITVSGRFIAATAVEWYVIDQVGTNYSPAPGGENAIRPHEGAPVRADVVSDGETDGYREFSVEYQVHASLTSRLDGTVFDGLSHQGYLVLGGGYGTLTAPDGSTYPASAVMQQENNPLYSSHFVPLTFEGGADVLTVDTPVSVDADPASTVVDLGATVTFESAVSGDPSPELQWEVSESNGEAWEAIPGETSPTLTKTVSIADDGLQYRLRASNRISTAYSAPAILSVDVPEEEPVPYDPGRITFVTDGSWARATPIVDLVEGQEVAVEARYSAIQDDWNGQPYPHLPAAQTTSTAEDPINNANATLFLGSAVPGGYSAGGSVTVHRYVTAEDGTITDCVVTQCYLTVGGMLLQPDWSGFITDPAQAPAAVYWPANNVSYDNAAAKWIPIFFEGTELVPPAEPVRNLPAFTTQPADATVMAGYAAQFQAAVTGDPAPTYQWQRSVDGGESWQTVRGETLASIRITTTEDLDGYRYRVRATNEVGTVYSEAATLAVTPNINDGNNPLADITRKGISLDWIGSPELQRRTPAYTPSYYSAGVSEGNKATYKNTEGNVVIVFRPKDGSAEHATTYETTWAHLPIKPSDPPTGDLQLVRLNNGLVDRDADGGGTIRWNATWSINFYGGLVPFTITNPVLTWDAHGTGTLTGDLSGWGSSMDNPDVKFPLEPALGATIATFSNATIDQSGTFSATPDYAGVEVTTTDDASPQLRTGDGWGSWPQSFVDFQFKTGLSSYWYSSGGAADAWKAPSPLTVSGLTGFTITPAVPEAPAAPTVTAASGTELDVSWSAPEGTAATGYVVTATHGDQSTTAEVDGSTLSTRLTGLALGTEYAVTVTAKNAAGASDPSAATTARTHGAPDAPAQPTLAAGDGTSVVATWTAPESDGGSAITGYLATLRSGDEVVATRSAAEPTATFEGLARGAAYTVDVAAQNALGTSAASAASDPVTIGAIAPDAPAAPVVTPGVGSLEVAWTAPAANGSAILDYTVTATPAAGGAPVTATVPALSATLPSLGRGTVYDVTVTARNEAGSSAASAATSATTLAEAPSGLAAPTVTAVSGTELHVAWVAPADDGGVEIVGYRVDVFDGDTVVQTVQAEGDVSSATVAGLDRGTGYTVTVTADNGTGTTTSEASDVVRTLDVPAAPVVTAERSGATGVTASWTAPADGGSPVTEYLVTFRDGDAVVETRVVPTGTETVTVDGLAPGAQVTASVVARNAVGDSAAGASEVVAIPAVAPDAVATPSIAGSGDTSVLVRWVAPAFDGGSPVTGYTVSLIGPDGVTTLEVAADATTASFDGLAAGSYSASVVAVNAVGASEVSEASPAVKIAGPKPDGSPTLATDDLFTEDSAGGISVTVSNGVATITVPGHEGEWVGVSFHSDPVWLGWNRVAEGAVSVELPAGATGVHHLVVYAADGSVIGYAAVDLGSGAGTGSGTGTGAASGTGLATTGGQLDLGAVTLAALLLLGGAGAFVVRRRQVSRR